MKQLLVSLLFFTLLSHTLMAQDKVYSPKRFGSPPTPADEDQILELMDNYSMGWFMEDARMLAATYDERAEFVNDKGDLEYGRDDIKEFYTRLFEASDSGDEASQNSGARISIRYLGDKVAVFHSFTRPTQTGSQPVNDSHYSHSTFVLNKTTAEGWKIVHHMVMDVPI